MPSVLLVSNKAEDEVESEVIAWSAENGYQVYQVDPEAELEERLEERNLQIVVSVASGLGADLASAAGRWKYLAVDEQEIRPSEFISVISSDGARDEEVGFLAGITAGLGHQTGAVGILVDGTDPAAEPLGLGFNQGVKFTCPRCKVASQLLDSWEDGVFTREAVRLVFVPLLTGADETLNELVDLGYWLIVRGSTPRKITYDGIAVVVSFQTGTLVRNALDEIHAGEQGKAWLHTTQNGGLRLDRINSDVISPGREKRLLEIQRQLESGELEIGLNN
jgi:hypothetical protein